MERVVQTGGIPGVSGRPQKPLVARASGSGLGDPEHWAEGQGSILHNGEARRKGLPRWLGGLRSTEEGPSPDQGRAPGPLVGVGVRRVCHHLGT